MTQDTHGMFLNKGRFLTITLTTGDKWTGTVDVTDAAGLYIVTDPGDEKVFLPWASILFAK